MDSIAEAEGAAGRVSPARCRNPSASPAAPPRWAWRWAWAKSPCRAPTRFVPTWVFIPKSPPVLPGSNFPAPRSCCWDRPGAGGTLRVGHALMTDMLDMDGVYAAIRNAGLTFPDRPSAQDLKGKLVSMFIKCEPNRNARLRPPPGHVQRFRHPRSPPCQGGGGRRGYRRDRRSRRLHSVDAMHRVRMAAGPVSPSRTSAHEKKNVILKVRA